MLWAKVSDMVKHDVRDGISFLPMGRHGCGDWKRWKKTRSGRLPEVDNKGFGVVDQALETVSYRQNTTTEGRCVCV